MRVSTKTYQPKDTSLKPGPYIVTPYTAEVKVGKTGKRGLYITWLILASIEPGGENAVGRTFLKWCDVASESGAYEIIYIAKTFGVEAEGDTEDEDFINSIFNAPETDTNVCYYVQAMLTETERPGDNGKVYTSIELTSSRKTREPMLSPLSKAQEALVPDAATIEDLWGKVTARLEAAQAKRKSGGFGGGGSAPSKPKAQDYDDGFGSSGGFTANADEDIPF